MSLGAKKSHEAPAGELLAQLEVPLRRPLHVLVPLTLVLVGAVVSSYLLPKKYRSSTLILVESEKVPENFLQKMATQSSRERLVTVKEELLSRTRLEKVIEELNPYPEQMGRTPLTNLIDGMRGSISISFRSNDAFSIEYVHSDPATAMHVANRLATLFIEETGRARAEQVEGAYEFIESQLEDAKRELEKQEDALRLYKERRMGTLPEQLGANLSTLQRLQLEQQAVAENLRAAQDRQAFQEQLRGAPGGGGDPGTELAQLRAQLATLRGRYTDEHPDVRLLLTRIARLERELTEKPSEQAAAAVGTGSSAARAQLTQARLDVGALRAKQEDLERRIATFQSRVEAVPRTEQELATLTRDHQKHKDNYLALLNKKLEAQMAEKLEQRWKGEHFKILDPAHLPERPYFPNRTNFLLLGLVMGLVAGLGCSFGAEFLDHSVKTLHELEALVPGRPVLAMIPHVGPSASPFSGIRAAIGRGKA